MLQSVSKLLGFEIIDSNEEIDEKKINDNTETFKPKKKRTKFDLYMIYTWTMIYSSAFLFISGIIFSIIFGQIVFPIFVNMNYPSIAFISQVICEFCLLLFLIGVILLVVHLCIFLLAGIFYITIVDEILS